MSGHFLEGRLFPRLDGKTGSRLVAGPRHRRDPTNFRNSRSVEAWVGLTTRRYQSGKVDYDGHISRRGDRHLRWLLCEASAITLTRVRAESSLRTLRLGLRERIGFKRAAVAVACKLAVIMHAMLETSEVFEPQPGAAT